MLEKRKDEEGVDYVPEETIEVEEPADKENSDENVF